MGGYRNASTGAAIAAPASHGAIRAACAALAVALDVPDEPPSTHVD